MVSEESTKYRREMARLEAIKRRISPKLEAWKEYVRDEYRRGPEGDRVRTDKELV